MAHTWVVDYTDPNSVRFVHRIKSDTPLGAVSELLSVHPELKDLVKFSMEMSGDKVILRPLQPGEARVIGQAIIDSIMNKDGEHYVKTYTPEQGYQAMLSAHAQFVLDESIQAKREEHLRRLIDEALASKNEKQFHEAVAELKKLRKEAETPSA